MTREVDEINELEKISDIFQNIRAVSYTHLDVYKRQVLGSLTEKSSDLVQMSPWSLSQGGHVPMSIKNQGVVGTSSSPVLFGVYQ